MNAKFAVNLWATHYRETLPSESYSAVVCFAADSYSAGLPLSASNMLYVGVITQTAVMAIIAATNLHCRGWCHVWYTMLESRVMKSFHLPGDQHHSHALRLVYGLHVYSIVASLLCLLIISPLPVYNNLTDCSYWTERTRTSMFSSDWQQ